MKKKAYAHIEDWRNRPLRDGKYPYVYMDGAELIVGDKFLGILEAVGEVFPYAKYQRCTVHFYRNVFSSVPRSKIKLVAKIPSAIHAQESKKANAVVAQLKEMKLNLPGRQFCTHASLRHVAGTQVGQQ